MIRINLLPIREARRQASLRRQGTLLGVAVAAGVVVCVLMHFSVQSAISKRQTLLSTKQQELKQLEETSKEVKRFQQERDEIRKKLDVIAEIEKARTGPVRVMDAIASKIPKRVWLTKLEAEEGALEMEGHSLDAEIVAEFLTTLKEADVILNMELQETELKETDGLKLNAFKLRGKYYHPKPVVAQPQTTGKPGARR